jgi:hypothetical protein
MKTKPLLCPERVRLVPRQFSWVDHRLVRDRYICARSPRSLALYLFLCTVADAQGMSYYSDASLSGLLSFKLDDLPLARAELVAAGLIAFRKPFYQVLSLEPARLKKAVPVVPEGPRTGEVRSAGDILKSIFKAP